DRARDARLQHVGRSIVHQMLLRERGRALERRKLARALGAAGQVLAHRRPLALGQRGVQIRIEEGPALSALHQLASLPVRPNFSASRRRARDSRDITVPAGTPTTSPISAYDRPCTSRSTSTSRNSTGISASACVTNARSDW